MNGFPSWCWTCGPSWMALLIPVMIVVVVWSSFWKFTGLWFSARNNERIWFIMFLFINLVGILEIYYLYSRRSWPFGGQK